jgi:hypothetical protein
MAGNYAVFTACNLAYLPKALVLAESLLRHGAVKLKIYIIDRKCEVELPTSLAEFIWIENAGVPRLEELAFKYDVTEFSTSIKPFVTLKLLECFDKVVFLDPDTCVYNAIDGIVNELDKSPIVLTPHYLAPQAGDPADNDVGMMRFGSFNLGFYAVNGSDEALAFLRWWCDRCFNLCYFESQFGLSTDQKWVSIAPCFFPNLHVSFNVGYNVAFWNIHERTLSRSLDGAYLVNGSYPLIFFHFSAFDEKNPALLSKRAFPERGGDRRDWLELSQSYGAALQTCATPASKQRYGFDYMTNGDYISPTLRRAYACVLDELPTGHDPFDSNGPVGKFARKNFLTEKRGAPYVSNSYGDMGKHKVAFRVINSVMRLVLRVLGPNRFANFSRLLVYLSGYRQNRDLWRL